MPCFGPEGPSFSSNPVRAKYKFTDYVQNTAFLLEEALLELNREVDPTIIELKDKDDPTQDECDFVTRNLCALFKEGTETIDKLRNVKHAAHLSMWKAEHDDLDKKRIAKLY